MDWFRGLYEFKPSLLGTILEHWEWKSGLFNQVTRCNKALIFMNCPVIHGEESSHWTGSHPEGHEFDSRILHHFCITWVILFIFTLLWPNRPDPVPWATSSVWTPSQLFLNSTLSHLDELKDKEPKRENIWPFCILFFSNWGDDRYRVNHRGKMLVLGSFQMDKDQIA